MAMLLAALAAHGDSVIHNIGQIERGYERIDERLRAVGAQIEKTGSVKTSHHPFRRPSFRRCAKRRSVTPPSRAWSSPNGPPATASLPGSRPAGTGSPSACGSDENVGQVMSRWRAVGAAVRPRFPGVILAHQVHGTTVQWHPAASHGWLIVDGVDGHATGARGLLLTITVADCIPVYLVAPPEHVVALLHGRMAGGLREASWSAAWSS